MILLGVISAMLIWFENINNKIIKIKNTRPMQCKLE